MNKNSPARKEKLTFMMDGLIIKIMQKRKVNPCMISYLIHCIINKLVSNNFLIVDNKT